MNQPATLFDLGMVRMREFSRAVWTPELTAKVRQKALKLTPDDFTLGNVVYEWDRNLITISASFVGEPSEQLCVQVLELWKDVIAPSRHRSSSREFVIKSLTTFFDHVNHSSIQRPSDLDENLAATMLFSVGISERPGLGSPTVYCDSRLFDSTPRFTKYK